MRKFYTLFASVVLSAIVCTVSAQTIKVDDATKVEVYNTQNYSQVTVQNGDNAVGAGSYRIRCNDYSSCFNKVEKNGTAVSESYGSYEVTLAEGDVLDIVTKFEADNYTVTVNAAEGLVASATAAGTTVENISSFAAPAGKKVVVTFNSTYDITSVTVNGETVSPDYNGNVEFWVKGDVTFAATGEKKAVAKVIVDDATKVSVMNSSYQQMTIVNGEQDMVAASYQVKSVDYYYNLNKVEKNGEAVSDSYGTYSVTLAKDDVLKITAAYPTETGAVKITAPEGVVKSAGYYLTYVKTEVDDPCNFTVKCGYKAEISYDQVDYNVKAVKINGEEMAVANGRFEFVVKGETNIEIVAETKASATLSVDNASLVSISTESGTAISVVDGFQDLKEGTYRINCSNYNYVLNGVELNHVAASEMSGTYMVTVKGGDTLVVKANYAEQSYKLTITDELKVISRIVAAGQEISDISDEVTVPAGAKLDITTSSSFKLEGAKVNGESIQVYGTSINFAVKGNTTLEVLASEYAKITATLKVTDPAHISVYEGTQYNMNTSSPIALSGTDNEIKVSEVNGYIYIKNNNLCKISSVTADGQTMSANWEGVYSVKVTEGMVIEVVSSELESKKAKVTVTGKQYASNYFGFTCQATRTDVVLAEGENELKFTDESNTYSMIIVGDGIESVSVKQNGNDVAPTYQSQNQYNFTVTFSADDEVIIDINNTYAQYTAIGQIVRTDAKNKTFTVGGVRVNGDVKALPKGVYIINGKKVVKK